LFKANVRRLMVLGMAELPPPKLKRVHSLAENLTLSYEEAFGQPIKLQRSFPVSDDRLTSGISRQGKIELLGFFFNFLDYI
jgi:hypothetical protein